ncbi:SusC/RagA family TonB-linked outer membrane protein [Marinifilum sp.]|uniref:SusC/RagA family TonB-linked outer membrane protein n=1 Tax=Marinifilum sp. TaxID=2033137 RepID=UPI003BA8B477
MKKLEKRVHLSAPVRKILRAMKISVFLVLVCSLQLSASVMLGQQVKMQEGQASVREVFKEFKKQTGVYFMYNEEEVDNSVTVKVDFDNMSLEEALNDVCEQANLEYQIVDDYVLIKKKELIPDNQEQQQKSIKGKVTDKNGMELPGVSVIIKGTYTGTSTNMDGVYQIKVSEGDVLVFSFVGMLNHEVRFEGQAELNVVMEEAETKLDDVIVTGLYERRKQSFTGTATTVSGEELMEKGVENVIQSLVLVDPSLNITENNLAGSNPNNMPELRLRGTSVLNTGGFGEISRENLIGDPNLPTFILDGFETTMEKVLDMDMNRVSSVTILKDAAATAQYGSKAANGVIVITTKRPKSGKLQVSYNTNIGFSFPDLSSYNMLDGSELFELQKKLNIYNVDGAEWDYKAVQIERNLASGVNTDWMSQPLRNTVKQKHYLNLTGGSEKMLYNIDLNYSSNPGVMKDSYRRNAGIAIALNYNLNDKIRFRNQLTVNRNYAKESPYGSFLEYTRIPDYFPMRDEYGELLEKFSYTYYDDTERSFGFRNPMQEATVGNVDKSKYTDITDNLQFDWRMTDALRFIAKVSYSYKTSEDTWFKSPDSFVYARNGINPLEKGEYRYTHRVDERWEARAQLNYNKTFNGHIINASLINSLSESSYNVLGFSAQGFASSNLSNPAFASGYEIGGLPTSNEGSSRTFNMAGNINYSFKDRYLCDITYNWNGSSAFGTKNKFAGFYGFGLGWNVHEENFLKDNGLFNRLRIKANYGQRGTVNFSPYQAKDMVTYDADNRYLGGLPTSIIGLGNESLVWQTTNTLDIGTDFGLFNRFDFTFNYFKNETVDMVSDITTPPSTGFLSFADNLGEMEVKGFEFSARANLIRKNDITWSVNVNGYHDRTKLLSINDNLSGYNDYADDAGLSKEQQTGLGADLRYAEASHDFLVRFEEGGSTTAIWAVRSLGIDPATGKEIFMTKDGGITDVYNPDDQVIVGNTAPDLLGNFGTQFRYKNLNIGMTFSYSFGSDAYNRTLVDKIENSSKVYNVDRRALNEAWLEPGDIVKYKTNHDFQTGAFNEKTPSSSRFVQKNNYIRFSSLNINYLMNNSFTKKLGLESLRISLLTNELFYISTIERERGLDYPFERSFTVGLRANF